MPCHVDAAAPAHSRAIAAPPPCDAPQPTPASATADPGSFSPTSPPRTSMDHAALESVNSVATAPETPQPTVVQAASPDDSSVRSGSAQQHLVSPAPDAPYDRHTPAVGGQEKTASPVSPFGSTSDPLAADDDADDALTEDDPRATRRPTFSHTQSSYAKSHGSSNPAAAAAARDAIPDPLADSLGSAGSTPQPRPSGTVAPSARHLLDAEPAQSQAELRGKDHLKERGDENEEDIEDRDDSDSEDEAPDNEPRPSGWFAEAPLVFDMVFNSARSRFSTAVAYATFGALFFFVLTLRTFSFSSSTAAAQISPAKDLPATATLGAPLPAFSFRVLKKDKKPDTDVVVAARFLPSAFHDQLRVALGPDAARDATAAAASVAGPARDVPAVSCAEVLTTAVAPLQFNRYAASLCDPDGFLFSAEATTNGDGVAHFEGVTVGIGAPGTYTVVIQRSDRTGPVYTQSLAFAAPALVVDSGVPATPLAAPLGLGAPFTVSFRIRFGTAVAAETGEAPRNATVAHATAALVAVDPRPATTATSSLAPPVAQLDGSPTAVTLTSSTAALQEGTVTFSAAAVRAARKASIHLGISIFGTVTLIAPAAAPGPKLHPPVAAVAFAVTPPAGLALTSTLRHSAAARSMAALSTAPHVTVAEGDPLPAIDVAVAGGTSLSPAVWAKARLRQAAVPGADPKRLFASVVMTAPATGTAAFTKLTFTATGAIGLYELSFECLGRSTAAPIIVNVTSVAAATLHFPPLAPEPTAAPAVVSDSDSGSLVTAAPTPAPPESDVERPAVAVGQRWAAPPMALVLSLRSGVPQGGQTISMVATPAAGPAPSGDPGTFRSTGLTLSYNAVTSTRTAGAALLTDVVVTSATTAGRYRFTVVLSGGMVVGEFFRNVTLPSDYDLAAYVDCAAARVTSLGNASAALPFAWVAGTALPLSFGLLSQRGAPVAFGNATFTAAGRAVAGIALGTGTVDPGLSATQADPTVSAVCSGRPTTTVFSRTFELTPAIAAATVDVTSVVTTAGLSGLPASWATNPSSAFAVLTTAADGRSAIVRAAVVLAVPTSNGAAAPTSAAVCAALTVTAAATHLSGFTADYLKSKVDLGAVPVQGVSAACSAEVSATTASADGAAAVRFFHAVVFANVSAHPALLEAHAVSVSVTHNTAAFDPPGTTRPSGDTTAKQSAAAGDVTFEASTAPLQVEVLLPPWPGQTAITPGVTSTVSPRVRVTNAGQSVAGIRVVCEAAPDLTSSAGRPFADVTSFLAANVVVAAVASVAATTTSVVTDLTSVRTIGGAVNVVESPSPFPAVSAETDSFGFASFDPVTVVASKAGTPFYLRFVLRPEAAVSSAKVGGSARSVAAQAAAAAIRSAALGPYTVGADTTASIISAAGVAIPQSPTITPIVGAVTFASDIGFNVSGNETSLPSSAAVAVVAQPESDPGAALLPLRDRDGGLPLYIPVAGAVTARGIVFPPGTTDGAHAVRLLLPGQTVAAVNASSLFVSRQVTSATLLTPLPAVIDVGREITARVRLTALDSTPVPGQAVSTSLSRTDCPSPAPTGACGQLSGGIGVTDATGEATVKFTVVRGGAGSYEFTFTHVSSSLGIVAPARYVASVAATTVDSASFLTGCGTACVSSSATGLISTLTAANPLYSLAASALTGAASLVPNSVVDSLTGTLRTTIAAKTAAAATVRSIVGAVEVTRLPTYTLDVTFGSDTFSAAFLVPPVVRVLDGNDVGIAGAEVILEIVEKPGTSDERAVAVASKDIGLEEGYKATVDGVTSVRANSTGYVEYSTATKLEPFTTNEVHLRFVSQGVASAVTPAFSPATDLFADWSNRDLGFLLMVFLLPLYYSLMPFTHGLFLVFATVLFGIYYAFLMTWVIRSGPGINSFGVHTTIIAVMLLVTASMLALILLFQLGVHLTRYLLWKAKDSPDPRPWKLLEEMADAPRALSPAPEPGVPLKPASPPDSPPPPDPGQRGAASYVVRFFPGIEKDPWLLRVHHYARWLVSARRPRLSQEEWESVLLAKKIATPLGKAVHVVYQGVLRVDAKIASCFDRLKECCKKKPDPKDALETSMSSQGLNASRRRRRSEAAPPQPASPAKERKKRIGDGGIFDPRAQIKESHLLSSIAVFFTGQAPSTKNYEPPPMQCPEDMDPARVPLRFLVGGSVSLGLVTTVAVLCGAFARYLNRSISYAVSALPPTPDVTSAERDSVNGLLQDGLAVALQTVSAQTGLEAFTTLIPSVRDIDFIAIWDTTLVIAEIFEIVFQLAAVVGLLLACIGFIACWLMLWRSTVNLQLALRRNDAALKKFKSNDPHLIQADRYVGVQAMNFILLFVLLFFVGVVIVLVVAVVITVYKYFPEVIHRLALFLASTLTITVVTMFTEKVIVNRFLIADGSITIKHNVPYSMWSGVAIVLGIVNGIMGTIVRFGLATASLLIMFGRLDMDVFPRVFIFLDTAYNAYYSMLLVDEEYNNPVFLSAAAALSADSLWIRYRRRLYHAQMEAPKTGMFTAFMSALISLKNDALKSDDDKDPDAEPEKPEPAPEEEPPVELKSVLLDTGDVEAFTQPKSCSSIASMRVLMEMRLRELSGNPIDPRVPLRAPLLAAPLSDEEWEVMKQQRRKAARRQLLVLLLLNPSLREMRKHAIAARVAARVAADVDWADRFLDAAAAQDTAEATERQVNLTCHGGVVDAPSAAPTIPVGVKHPTTGEHS